MAGSVGEMLTQHASGLSMALNALITDAIAADHHQKQLAFELQKEAMALPPFRFYQHIVYDERLPNDTVRKQVVTYELLVPSVILLGGHSLEIQKYNIKSTFESMIKKATGVQSDTTASVGAKAGFLGIPSISVDVTQKIAVNHSRENSQHNTLDVEIEMGQSEPSFGYTELVKALMRAVNTILDDVLKKGLTNARAISEEEAAKLQEPEPTGDETQAQQAQQTRPQ